MNFEILLRDRVCHLVSCNSSFCVSGFSGYIAKMSKKELDVRPAKDNTSSLSDDEG